MVKPHTSLRTYVKKPTVYVHWYMIVQQLQQLLQLMKGQFFLLINNTHFCNHVEKVLNIHAKLFLFLFLLDYCV